MVSMLNVSSSSQIRLYNRATRGIADETLLATFLTFRFLTVAQLVRLYYAPGSVSTAHARLLALTRRGLLVALPLPTRRLRGSSPLIYTLTHRAHLLLAQRGYPVPKRTRLDEDRERSERTYRHDTAVTDCLISLRLLERQHPWIRVPHLLAEHQLPKVVATIPRDGQPPLRRRVIPDAWFRVQVGHRSRCIALEVDRSTEGKRWRPKVAALVAMTAGAYQQAYQTSSLTVAVLVLPGKTTDRLDTFRRATERELSALGMEAKADLFRIAAGVPADLTPRDLFLSPRWYRPYAVQPLPLLSPSADDT